MFKIIYTVQLYQFPPYMCLSTELPNLTTFIDSNITDTERLKKNVIPTEKQPILSSIVSTQLAMH